MSTGCRNGAASGLSHRNSRIPAQSDALSGRASPAACVHFECRGFTTVTAIALDHVGDRRATTTTARRMGTGSSRESRSFISVGRDLGDAGATKIAHALAAPTCETVELRLGSE